MKAQNLSRLMHEEHLNQSQLQVIHDEKLKRTVIVREVAVTKSSYITIPITSPRLLVQELSKWTLRRLIGSEHREQSDVFLSESRKEFELLKKVDWTNANESFVKVSLPEELLNNQRPLNN